MHTHNHHKHHGAQVDDEEEESDHGEGEDASHPPVLPSKESMKESVEFNPMIKTQMSH